MKYLGNDYQVEEGNGGDRHPYLREHNIQSYLVIPPDDTHGVRTISINSWIVSLYCLYKLMEIELGNTTSETQSLKHSIKIIINS